MEHAEDCFERLRGRRPCKGVRRDSRSEWLDQSPLLLVDGGRVASGSHPFPTPPIDPGFHLLARFIKDPGTTRSKHRLGLEETRKLGPPRFTLYWRAMPRVSMMYAFYFLLFRFLVANAVFLVGTAFAREQVEVAGPPHSPGSRVVRPQEETAESHNKLKSRKLHYPNIPGLTTPASMRFELATQQGRMCGPNAVRILCKYFDILTSYEPTIAKIRVSDKGISLTELKDLAHAVGVPGENYKLSPDQLYQLEGPIVIHMNSSTPEGDEQSTLDHFLVYLKVDRDNVYAIDTINGGLAVMPKSMIGRSMSGYVFVPYATQASTGSLSIILVLSAFALTSINIYLVQGAPNART